MTESRGIWFVFRSPGEGPLGKRVRRLSAPSILAWFQAHIEEARIANDPSRVAADQLGGPVQGLVGLFEAAKKLSLHTPKTTAALTKLLQEHLHAGGEDVHVDAHSVRVLASDERGELAYFFFDEEALGRLPRNLAYLVHDQPSLPEGDADRPFATAPLHTLAPAGAGEGATYACLLEARSLTGRAVVIPGVRLPDLAAHLRSVTPEPAELEAWPAELRLLQTKIEAGDTQLGPALRRVAAEGAIVFENAHAALLAGDQRWVFFDDRWAAANPDLATSILHHTEHADPFLPLRPTKVAAPAAKPKATGDKAPSKPRPAAAAKAASKSKAAADKAAAKDEQTWKTALGDRDVASALGYRMTMRFDTGNLVAHTKFGVGVVTRAEGTKVEVLFRDGPRILLHGASA